MSRRVQSIAMRHKSYFNLVLALLNLYAIIYVVENLYFLREKKMNQETCYADMMETISEEVIRNIYYRTGKEIFCAKDDIDEIQLEDKKGNTISIYFSLKQLDDVDVELLGLTPPENCEAVQRVDISLILKNEKGRLLNVLNWTLKPYNSTWDTVTNDICADLMYYTHPTL